jgi:hypothetical protein
MRASRRRINRKHRRRAKAIMRHGGKAVRSHSRPRPNGRKIRVKHW